MRIGANAKHGEPSRLLYTDHPHQNRTEPVPAFNRRCTADVPRYYRYRKKSMKIKLKTSTAIVPRLYRHRTGNVPRPYRDGTGGPVPKPPHARSGGKAPGPTINSVIFEVHMSHRLRTYAIEIRPLGTSNGKPNTSYRNTALNLMESSFANTPRSNHSTGTFNYC